MSQAFDQKTTSIAEAPEIGIDVEYTSALHQSTEPPRIALVLRATIGSPRVRLANLSAASALRLLTWLQAEYESLKALAEKEK
jgi:hypothetical protein